NVRASLNSLRTDEELPVRDSETEWIKIAVQETALSLEEHRQRHGLVRLYGGDRLVEHSPSLLGRASLLRERSRWERESRDAADHKCAEHWNPFVFGLGAASGSRAVRLYFALPRLPNLSDSAKDLFIAAMDAKRPQPVRPAGPLAFKEQRPRQGQCDTQAITSISGRDVQAIFRRRRDKPMGQLAAALTR